MMHLCGACRCHHCVHDSVNHAPERQHTGHYVWWTGGETRPATCTLQQQPQRSQGLSHWGGTVVGGSAAGMTCPHLAAPAVQTAAVGVRACVSAL